MFLKHRGELDVTRVGVYGSDIRIKGDLTKQ